MAARRADKETGLDRPAGDRVGGHDGVLALALQRAGEDEDRRCEQGENSSVHGSLPLVGVCSIAG